MEQPYHSHSLDHLGLVAGMFDELGISDVIDRASDPVKPGDSSYHRGKRRQGDGSQRARLCEPTALLGAEVFSQEAPSRLLAPSLDAQHLDDDTLGRSLDTLYNYGVPALYSLVATTAAQRLGFTPTFAHLDSTSFRARYKGRKHAARGFRILKDSLFLASSLYFKRPERIMALLMVMTVGLLWYTRP
jgi:hypothetical protein